MKRQCLFTKDIYLESGKWWAEPGQTIHTHPITQRKKGTVTQEIGFILGSAVYDKSGLAVGSLGFMKAASNH